MLRQKRGLAELLKDLTEQECYKKYVECLEKIKEDEELYEKLNEFRRRNVEIHLKKGTLKEEAVLEREFHSLLLNERIHEFLDWEQKTLDMLRMVHDEIDRGMNLDFNFF